MKIIYNHIENWVNGEVKKDAYEIKMMTNDNNFIDTFTVPSKDLNFLIKLLTEIQKEHAKN